MTGGPKPQSTGCFFVWAYLMFVSIALAPAIAFAIKDYFS